MTNDRDRSLECRWEVWRATADCRGQVCGSSRMHAMQHGGFTSPMIILEKDVVDAAFILLQTDTRCLLHPPKRVRADTIIRFAPGFNLGRPQVRPGRQRAGELVLTRPVKISLGA